MGPAHLYKDSRKKLKRSTYRFTLVILRLYAMKFACVAVNRCKNNNCIVEPHLYAPVTSTDPRDKKNPLTPGANRIYVRGPLLVERLST